MILSRLQATAASIGSEGIEADDSLTEPSSPRSGDTAATVSAITSKTSNDRQRLDPGVNQEIVGEQTAIVQDGENVSLPAGFSVRTDLKLTLPEAAQ